MAYQTFRELVASQKAMDLAVDVYEFSRQFPSEEKFGLTSQIRRASVSVPSNIAEGHGRRTSKDFANFLWIANGSIGEIETQALLAERLGFASQEATKTVMARCDEVGRITRGLRTSLDRN